MINFGNQIFKVNKGDKIAQLICENITYPELVDCSELNNETDRGIKGFGSSGLI